MLVFTNQWVVSTGVISLLSFFFAIARNHQHYGAVVVYRYGEASNACISTLNQTALKCEHWLIFQNTLSEEISKEAWPRGKVVQSGHVSFYAILITTVWTYSQVLSTGFLQSLFVFLLATSNILKLYNSRNIFVTRDFRSCKSLGITLVFSSIHFSLSP